MGPGGKSYKLQNDESKYGSRPQTVFAFNFTVGYSLTKRGKTTSSEIKDYSPFIG